MIKTLLNILGSVGILPRTQTLLVQNCRLKINSKVNLRGVLLRVFYSEYKIIE